MGKNIDPGPKGQRFKPRLAPHSRMISARNRTARRDAEGERGAKNLVTLLDLCVSSLRRGHANLLCIVPILSDDLRGESTKLKFPAITRTALRRFQCSRGGPAFTIEAGAAEPAMCQTRGPKVVGSSPGLGTVRLRSKGYVGQAPRIKPTTQDESREELILGGKKLGNSSRFVRVILAQGPC